jgi:hypothetical protein
MDPKPIKAVVIICLFPFFEKEKTSIGKAAGPKSGWKPMSASSLTAYLFVGVLTGRAKS